MPPGSVCGGYSLFFLLRRLGPSIPSLQKKYQKYQTYPKIIESLQPPKNMPILYLNLNLGVTLSEPPSPKKFKI